MQTVLLGSSSGAIVEFVIPEAGNYVMVDHHFANASQGAIGIIKAGAIPRGSDSEHHNIPATAAPTDLPPCAASSRSSRSVLPATRLQAATSLAPTSFR